MHKVLKDEGIKNNKFFLWINDESLIGIDPYSSNLNQEQKLRIKNEISINYWYFLREIVRIPEAGGVTFFQLNRANLAQSFLLELNINIIEIMPRQTGKTIGAECRYTWVLNYGTINTTMMFGNKQLNDSRENIKRFNLIIKELPDYLKTHFNDKNDKNNIDEWYCGLNNNTIKAMSCGRDESGADRLGFAC